MGKSSTLCCREQVRGMFKIANEKLLLIAGIVWVLAGANIANIGLGAYWHEWDWYVWALIGGTLIIFVLFHALIFSKMVGKHVDRIHGYKEDKTHFLKFFDKKGYIMMAIMMGGGMALRFSGLVPDWFIAFFYTGLGVALAVAGISFLLRYFRGAKTDCPVLPGTYGRHDH